MDAYVAALLVWNKTFYYTNILGHYFRIHSIHISKHIIIVWHQIPLNLFAYLTAVIELHSSVAVEEFDCDRLVHGVVAGEVRPRPLARVTTHLTQTPSFYINMENN